MYAKPPSLDAAAWTRRDDAWTWMLSIRRLDVPRRRLDVDAQRRRLDVGWRPRRSGRMAARAGATAAQYATAECARVLGAAAAQAAKGGAGAPRSDWGMAAPAADGEACGGLGTTAVPPARDEACLRIGDGGHAGSLRWSVRAAWGASAERLRGQPAAEQTGTRRCRFGLGRRRGARPSEQGRGVGGGGSRRSGEVAAGGAGPAPARARGRRRHGLPVAGS